MNKLMLLVVFVLSFSVRAEFVSFSSHKGQKDVSFTEQGKFLGIKFNLDGIFYQDLGSNKFYQKGAFQEISVKGLKNTSVKGEPSLPYKSFLVNDFPENIQVSINYGQSYSLKGLLPSPAQEMPCRCDKEKKIEFSVNWDAYQNSESSVVTLKFLGDFKGRPITQVLVRPFKLQENMGVVAYPELAVRLTSKMSGQLEKFEIGKVNGSNREILIIGPHQLVNGLDSLIERRKKQGYGIRVLETDGLNASFDELKNLIHGEYGRSPFDFALILGDENTTPMEYVRTSSSDQTPSDMHYFTMGGESDRIPDVFYGRITAQTEEQVRAQVFKILEYEKRTWANKKGLGYLMGIASDEGFKPTDVEYMKNMTNPFKKAFNTKPDYYFQENLNSKPSNILKSLNRGLMWVNYIGHGSGNSWVSVKSGEFYSSHLAQLKSGAVKPVIIDVACQNGRFNNAGRLGESFMNQLSDGKPVGAVAFYGGSVDISWHPPAIMAVAVNDYVSKGSVKRLGPALLQGQMKLIESYDDKEASLENLVWYHLLGDPTLNLQLQ